MRLAIEAWRLDRDAADRARRAGAGSREILALGLDADLLLVTGGVSAGQRDLVPAALAALGVRACVSQGASQAGQTPLVRSRTAAGRSPGALVFGLPGNPVSGLVGFLLFVQAGAGEPGRQAQPSPPVAGSRGSSADSLIAAIGPPTFRRGWSSGSARSGRPARDRNPRLVGIGRSAHRGRGRRFCHLCRRRSRLRYQVKLSTSCP